MQTVTRLRHSTQPTAMDLAIAMIATILFSVALVAGIDRADQIEVERGEFVFSTWELDEQVERYLASPRVTGIEDIAVRVSFGEPLAWSDFRDRSETDPLLAVSEQAKATLTTEMSIGETIGPLRTATDEQVAAELTRSMRPGFEVNVASLRSATVEWVDVPLPLWRSRQADIQQAWPNISVRATDSAAFRTRTNS